MKRTDRTTKLVSLLLFLALAAYLIVYFIGSLTDPTQTSPAVLATVVDSGRSEGLIVRSEELITSSLPYLDVLAQDNKHVSRGETIAVSYSSEDGLAQEQQIQTLQLQLAQEQLQLQNAQAGAGSSTAVEDATLALSRAVARGESSSFDALALNVSSLLFDGGTPPTQADVDALQTQLTQLQNAVPAQGATPILAGESGTFSTAVDGYESLTPDMLEDLSPSGVDALAAQQRSVESGAIGKLITSQTWYYAAKLSDDDGARLQAGEEVTADFGRYLAQPVTLRVERVSAPENGQRAVLFSCEQELSSTLTFRQVTVDIEFASHSGLRVPTQALYTDDDGGKYVYVYTVMYVEKKPVNVVYEGDGYVLVSVDPADSDALREGNEIIVKGKDLYDGKILE